MCRRQIVIPALVVLMISFNCLFALEPLTILVEDDPYQVNDKREPYGAAIEITRELMKRVGAPDRMKVIAWDQGYKQAQQGKGIILILGARTPEREKMFKWVGPIDRDAICLYAKKGKGSSIITLDDAKKVQKIGCLKGSVEEEYLKQQGFTNIEISEDIASNVQNFMNGATDLIAMGPANRKSIMESAGYKNEDVEQVVVAKDIQYSLIVSKDVSDATVNLLNAKLNDIKKEGLFDQIFARNKQTIPSF